MSQITESANYATYEESAPPAIGGAGSTVFESVFNTTILKATDSSSVGGNVSCRAVYSNVQVFNKDSTWLYATCAFVGDPSDHRAVFAPFNPTTFSVGTWTQLNNTINCIEGWMWWSRVNPKLIYCHTNTALYFYHVDTQAFTLIKSFAGDLLAEGNVLRQMSVSADDDVFCWRQDVTSKGHTVWKRSTDTILYNELDPIVDENYLDKTGRYFILGKNTGSNVVIDLHTMNETTMTIGDNGWFHHDQGNGTIFVGNDNGNNTNLVLRPLSSPTSETTLLAGATPWTYGTQSDHFSMTAENNEWALCSRYSFTGGPVINPFDNELVQVSTNGSLMVRRLGHHYVNWGEYYDSPFANMSPDGRFVAFSSNWGTAAGRMDVYIMKIIPAPALPQGSIAPIKKKKRLDRQRRPQERQ